jgi:protein SCO1/2
LFALIDKNGNIRCRKDDYGNSIFIWFMKKGQRNIQQDITLLEE